MRFVLTQSVWFVSPFGRTKLCIGDTVADIVANAKPSDFVLPTLCAKPTEFMEPLDADAVLALAAQGLESSVACGTACQTYFTTWSNPYADRNR